MAANTTGSIDSRVSHWKQLFAEAVVRTCPEINPDLADEVADDECACHETLAPELAAAQWAARIWPDIEGQP